MSHIDLRSMSREELLALNKQIVAQVRNLDYAKALQVGSKFVIGQKVKFRDRMGQTRFMEIEKINVKSVAGSGVNEFGDNTGIKWRVHPSFLTPAT